MGCKVEVGGGLVVAVPVSEGLLALRFEESLVRELANIEDVDGDAGPREDRTVAGAAVHDFTIEAVDAVDAGRVGAALGDTARELLGKSRKHFLVLGPLTRGASEEADRGRLQRVAERDPGSGKRCVLVCQLGRRGENDEVDADLLGGGVIGRRSGRVRVGLVDVRW